MGRQWGDIAGAPVPGLVRPQGWGPHNSGVCAWQEGKHKSQAKNNVCLALAFVSFQGLGVVLLMEKAGMARCLPGTPRPFRKPCCQLSSALPASRGVCSPFLEKLHLETEFACSKPSYFLLFQVGTTNPIARQFLLHQTLQWCSSETQEAQNDMDIFQWFLVFFSSKCSFFQENEKFCPLWIFFWCWF